MKYWLYPLTTFESIVCVTHIVIDAILGGGGGDTGEGGLL